MGLLTRLASSPPLLLACLVVGFMSGRFFPDLGGMTLPGQIYLGIVGMASLPLLVVATFFGLRQTLTLPRAGRRLLMIGSIAAALVLFCSLTGTLFGAIAQPGAGLDHPTRAYLGSLVQQAGGDAADAVIALDSSGDLRAAESSTAWLSDLVPDNFFRALVEGKSLGILICAIIFGIAFAAMGSSPNAPLNTVFEAIYRALEIIISRVNLFIPLLVFSMAAYFAARTDTRTLLAMGSFLGSFSLLALLLSALSVAVVRRQSGLGFAEVVAALKAPALISFTSASTTASIPDTIEAMSSRLGFSRGIVELVTPIASVFLRCGSALYYSLATVFVANLYARPLGPEELALTCVGAFLAAFASAGNNSAANVGFAGMVLSLLQLPAEAALAIFLAVDVICEGPRNLLTLLASCALIAFVSRGLPSERSTAAGASPAGMRPLQFAFTRADLVVGAICCFVIAALLLVLGIGIGMRRIDEVRQSSLGPDNGALQQKTR